MVEVSRNAPCPCGSGLKYKRCCLGKVTPGERQHRRLLLPVVIFVPGVALDVYMAMRHGAGKAVAVGLAVLILTALAWLLQDPPPPSGNAGDPGSINFGM